jgi:hypothetical protein
LVKASRMLSPLLEFGAVPVLIYKIGMRSFLVDTVFSCLNQDFMLS